MNCCWTTLKVTFIHSLSHYNYTGSISFSPSLCLISLSLFLSHLLSLLFSFSPTDSSITLSEEPKASLIFNQFHPPLPRISRRDLVALKMWVPQFLTQSNKSGIHIFYHDCHSENIVLALSLCVWLAKGPYNGTLVTSKDHDLFLLLQDL